MKAAIDEAEGLDRDLANYERHIQFLEVRTYSIKF